MEIIGKGTENAIKKQSVGQNRGRKETDGTGCYC